MQTPYVNAFKGRITNMTGRPPGGSWGTAVTPYPDLFDWRTALRLASILLRRY